MATQPVSKPALSARMQAALYYARKKNRDRRIKAQALAQEQAEGG